MFNESIDTRPNQKVKIMFQRNNNELLSPWEISHFINQFSSNYYKNELLISVSKALNSNIPAETIIILDDSFNINTSYSKLDVIDLNTIQGIKQLYHLGKPVSLYPNKKIYSINIIFLFFRRLNEIIYRKIHKRLSKFTLEKSITDSMTSHIREIIEELKHSSYLFLQKRGIKGKVEEIDKTYADILNRINNYEKEQIDVEIMGKKFLEEDFSLLKHENYRRLESKYYTSFFREFNNNSRPVVGIYYPDSNQIQILCVNHINKTRRDSRFLDLKQFSHNSPYIVEIMVGISIAIPLMKEIKYHIDEYKLRKRKVRLDEDTATIDYNLEKLYKELENITTDKGITAVENIKNEYIKNKIEETKDSNDKKINEPIKKYDFFLTDIIVKE